MSRVSNSHWVRNIIAFYHIHCFCFEMIFEMKKVRFINLWIVAKATNIAAVRHHILNIPDICTKYIKVHNNKSNLEYLKKIAICHKVESGNKCPLQCHKCKFHYRYRYTYLRINIKCK